MMLLISTFPADTDIKSTTSAKGEAKEERKFQHDTSEDDLNTTKTEIDAPVDSIFRLKVKKMQSRELVSRILGEAAKDRFDLKKSRVESVLGINVVENRQ